MVYTKARLNDALRAFRNVPNCRDRRALPSAKLASRLRSSRASVKVAPLGGVNWQAKAASSGSDDDEYDPKQEKRLLNTRKNKKKRKSDEVATSNDATVERDTKKLKANHTNQSIHGDKIFYTIRLTSEKGREFLQRIGVIKGVLKVGQSSSNVKLNTARRSGQRYFDKYLSSDAAHGGGMADLVDQGFMETDIDVEDECVSNKHKVLRSGKVVEKPAKKQKQKKSSKNKCRLTPPTSEDEANQHATVTKNSSNSSAAPRNRIHLKGPDEAVDTIVTKQANRSVCRPEKLLQGDTRANPLVLDTDDDEDTITVRRPVQPRREYGNSSLKTKKVDTSPVIKQETALPLSPVSLSRSRSRSSPTPPTPSKTLTISTAFSHPLNLLPPTTPAAVARLRCDFCVEPRMAIIGHGRCRVEVFTDPDNPLLYQEMGEGFRARGFDNTTICFDCVEKRVRIMRCHLKKKKDSKNTKIPSNDVENWGFEMMKVRVRIGGVSSNLLYQKWLFPPTHGKKQSQSAESKAPLETCSLCPMPALWRCCKGGTSGTEGVVRNEVGLAVSAQRNMSEKDEAGPPQNSNSSKRKNSTPARKPATEAEVIVIDSDSEDETSSSTVEGESLERQHGQASRISAKRPDTSCPAPRLGQKIGEVDDINQTGPGCGLKLCSNCKLIVADRCHGVLDKRWIMAQFNNVSGERRPCVTGRADIEFLFKGSVAHRYYEQQTKPRIEKVDDHQG